MQQELRKNPAGSCWCEVHAHVCWHDAPAKQGYCAGADPAGRVSPVQGCADACCVSAACCALLLLLLSCRRVGSCCCCCPCSSCCTAAAGVLLAGCCRHTTTSAHATGCCCWLRKITTCFGWVLLLLDWITSTTPAANSCGCGCWVLISSRELGTCNKMDSVEFVSRQLFVDIAGAGADVVSGG